MKIDLLILQIAVLLVPGFIWARLDARYALTSKPSETEFLLRSFLFGLVSYCITFVIYNIFGCEFTFINISDAETKGVVNAAVVFEIIWATLFGFLLSILWIYAARYKWLTHFLKMIGATKRYGDEDVWDYTFNAHASIASVEYIHFRDFEKELIYGGWVATFSETEKLRELVLQDVEVYNFDGQALYSVPMLYLARAPENLHIEFPYRKPTTKGETNA